MYVLFCLPKVPEDAKYHKELYLLRIYYGLVVRMSEIYFGGYVISTSEQINSRYLKLCGKIQKILKNSPLRNLSSLDWQPSDNLLSLDPEAPDFDWEYGKRQMCLDFKSEVEKFFITEGEKIFRLDPDGERYLTEFHSFLNNYESQKKDSDNRMMDGMITNTSQYMTPKDFERNSEIQKQQSSNRGKLVVEPTLMISKLEELLANLNPLKEKPNGTGEMGLLEISKKLRNLLKLGFEDGDQRVLQFNLEGGNFYRNLHAFYDENNSSYLSAQDQKYLENLRWHEIKIKEFLDEVNLSKELIGKDSANHNKETVYTPDDEHDFYKDILNMMKNAKNEVFIVDPWVDESLFALFVEHIPIDANVRILTKQPQGAFLDVGRKLSKKRSLEIATSTQIHDRYVFTDNKCWTIGSSLKDAAKNKPTTIIQINTSPKTLYFMHDDFFKNGTKLLSKRLE